MGKSDQVRAKLLGQSHYEEGSSQNTASTQLACSTVSGCKDEGERWWRYGPSEIEANPSIISALHTKIERTLLPPGNDDIAKLQVECA